MDERLRHLKRAMKKNVLNGLNFTEERKNKIRYQIKNLNTSSDDEILLAVLQLLVQERTGFEISRLVRARGIERFENDEGQLYMILHLLEQKGYLLSNWADADTKSYQLSNKGRKLLRKAEDKEFGGKPVFNELFEG